MYLIEGLSWGLTASLFTHLNIARRELNGYHGVIIFNVDSTEKNSYQLPLILTVLLHVAW